MQQLCILKRYIACVILQFLYIINIQTAFTRIRNFCAPTNHIASLRLYKPHTAEAYLKIREKIGITTYKMDHYKQKKCTYNTTKYAC